MPTDPFVAVVADDAPRHRQNLPAGVALPPSRSWKAERPGDLAGAQPEGKLLGSPGPNIGYALSLARRQQEHWFLAPGEHADDAASVVAEIAMRRAAMFGRAPVKADVDVAVALLGYGSEREPKWVERRASFVHEAQHDYVARRALVDVMPEELLRLRPDEIAPSVTDWVLPLGHRSLKSSPRG